MAETIFSKIIKGEIPAYKIYEDNNHLAFLDISPFEKGHTLVIPKKEYETIFDMPEEEFTALVTIVKKIATHMRKTLNCDINIWQNNGEIAGQEIPHIHFHVIPRTQKKKTYCLENKQHYDEGEAEEVAKQLTIT